jgi:hypothetical protein
MYKIHLHILQVSLLILTNNKEAVPFVNTPFFPAIFCDNAQEKWVCVGK